MEGILPSVVYLSTAVRPPSLEPPELPLELPPPELPALEPPLDEDPVEAGSAPRVYPRAVAVPPLPLRADDAVPPPSPDVGWASRGASRV